MTFKEREELRLQIEALRSGIREIAHDISSPLGVLRMAIYYLQTSGPDEGKREEYYAIMNDTIEKVEQCLKRLRGITDPSRGGTQSAAHQGGGKP